MRIRTPSFFSHLVLVLFALQIFLVDTAQYEDLYELLGVARGSTLQAIKRAYRRKAKDTHPDKRTDVSPDQATEEFQKIVQAFEILSDENSRRTYDRTGRYNTGRNNSQQQQHQQRRSNTYTFRTTQRKSMKDRQRVKRAMSRVMHFASLAQLKAFMLDDHGRLERNLLLCFVTPGHVEEVAHDEMVFPYPFAHMSEEGIWWEDLLQTGEIKVQESTKYLAQFFEIDEEEINKSKQPIFLFGRRGKHMQAYNFARLQTNQYFQFTNWVWQQLQVIVTFVNHHTHPVEGWWQNNKQAQLMFTLEPEQSQRQNSMLGHKWLFRDARVDTFPNAPSRNSFVEETMVAIVEMTNDTSPQTIHLEAKSCFDMSGHCAKWKQNGHCNRNQYFMKGFCALTCRYCNERNDAVKMMDIKKAKAEQSFRKSWSDEL